MDNAWEAALQAREDLAPFGDNALLLFALALGWQIEDVATIGASAIVDGPDDKNCDLIYVDHDNQRALIAQCYYSNTYKTTAPTNKASGLASAIHWLLTMPLDTVPDRLRPFAAELRDALTNYRLNTLEIWYVHNCEESKAVNSELQNVEMAAITAVRSLLDNYPIQIRVLEVGRNKLSEWYSSLGSPIVINDTIEVPIEGGFEIEGEDWRAYVTAVPAWWVGAQYEKHREELFSANVRGYLGSSRSELNINNGIKQTILNEPSRFWVYNNGITVLVHDYEVISHDTLTIKGLSIVNGAQTTGAIGSVREEVGNISEKAKVAIRFVKVWSKQTIENIRRFNNTQNEMEPYDFRSVDPIQSRLRQEFERRTDVKYTGRRGGAEDIIRRPRNLLAPDTVAQALAAFHGSPDIAYNQKSELWRNNKLYVQFFNDNTTAEHIVFAYSLLRSIEEYKVALVQKSQRNELTTTDKEQLDVLRKRGAHLLLVSAVAGCIEEFLGRRVSSLFDVSFGPASLDEAKAYWTEIITVTASFITNLEPALETGLKKREEIDRAMRAFRQSVHAFAVSGQRKVFDKFAERLWLRQQGQWIPANKRGRANRKKR